METNYVKVLLMLCVTFGFVCSQTEMKIKVLEAKHQEEKLRMQQRHDADVEKARMKMRNFAAVYFNLFYYVVPNPKSKAFFFFFHV